MTKLSKGKVSLFTGFHPNLGETNFCGFASSALKILPLFKALVGTPFPVVIRTSKLLKNSETFFHIAFVIYCIILFIAN